MASSNSSGANINPEGDLSDGRFEVVVVRRLNVFEICKAIFTDHSFHPERIEVFSTTEVWLKLHRKAYFQVDGEFMGKVTSVHARIMPQVLHVLVP